MILLGKQTDAGVTVETFWDIATCTMHTRRTDHASSAAKTLNQHTQNHDTKRRAKPGDGEYTIFRMSIEDRQALGRLYPDLLHTDQEIRTEAWNRLRYNPLSRPFQMTRPPGADKVIFGQASKAPQPSIII